MHIKQRSRSGELVDVTIPPDTQGADVVIAKIIKQVEDPAVKIVLDTTAVDGTRTVRLGCDDGVVQTKQQQGLRNALSTIGHYHCSRNYWENVDRRGVLMQPGSLWTHAWYFLQSFSPFRDTLSERKVVYGHSSMATQDEILQIVTVKGKTEADAVAEKACETLRNLLHVDAVVMSPAREALGFRVIRIGCPTGGSTRVRQRYEALASHAFGLEAEKMIYQGMLNNTSLGGMSAICD